MQKVEVELTCDEAATLTGDRQHLYAIFNNLILNAMDAMSALPKGEERPRRLRIRVSCSEFACEVDVEDSGVGMKSEEIARAFEPFYSTRPSKGTGLGLCTVRKYVSLYGGEAKFRSESGVGTTVRVVLQRGQSALA
ncbi:MAG: ATP-binding protein [Myxococcota bacterium]|nr:ATP-binding protein [Myxococcota bacterium]